MKKIKKQIVLLLLCLVSQFGMWAQYNEIGEYTESGEDYLSDLYKSEYLYKRETEKCDCEEGDNFSFDISGGATLEEIRLQNYERLIAYNIKKYKNWLKAQYKILEVEIEKQLGQQFSSFASAQTHYYKKLEAFHVSQNVGPVVETYATKVTHRIKAKTTCLSNIKLLEFWEEKINTGNANNSQYGHLKVGSTPLSALTTSEQLNALKKQEIASFGENEWRLVSEKNVKEKLMEIQSVNYKTTSHPIHEELSKLQKDYFYDYRDLDRLNLMQMYLTKQFIRGPIWPRMLSAYEDESVRSDPQHSGRQYRYVYPMASGSRSFIEDYAIRNNGGAISIFHPGFSSYYLFFGLFSVIKESQINMALKEISEEAMLLEICFENINIKNRNFIENNTALKEAVAAYFIENDYSKPAINFVGTMMKQYRTNLDFWPDPKYYVSYDGITSIPCPWDFSDRKESNIVCDARARYPVFQNANRKDLALEIMFKLEALRDGFLNFGDVIAALYSGSSYGGKKGYIIRNAFNANGFSIPSGLSNKTLETYFYFKKNAYGYLLGIYFKPGLGEFLFDNGISLQEFLDEYWENIEETANNDCEIGKAKDSNGNCVACVDKDVFGNCTKITWVRDADNDNYYAAGSERKEYASWTAATGFKKKSDALGEDCDDTDANRNVDCSDCDTSKEDLKKIFPTTSDTELIKIADAINKYGKYFGIDTKEKLQHFLSQAGHESAKFSAFEENLNYRWEKLGVSYWKRYFNPSTNPTADPNKANPNDYKRSNTSVYVDVEKFANRVYADIYRKNNIGNVNTGDGYKFRGRGVFQLTGRTNYTNFSAFYQANYDSSVNLLNNPDLVASNKEIAVISALWFYKKNVLDKIIVDGNISVEKVTEKVNGGTSGIEDRIELHTKTKSNIDCI